MKSWSNNMKIGSGAAAIAVLAGVGVLVWALGFRGSSHHNAVGTNFIYNPAVRYVKRLIDAGELGDVRYVYSQRLNLGRIRSDIDAMWNFAPHDISIIQYWLND